MPEHTGEGELGINTLDMRVEDLWHLSLSELKKRHDSQHSLNLLKALQPYLDPHVYLSLHSEYLSALGERG